MKVIIFLLVAVSQACTQNKIVEYLPTHWKDQLVDTLLDEPQTNDLKMCASYSSTCCSSSTMDIVQEIVDSELSFKTEIWKANFGLLIKFIEEHKRNFKHFEIEEERFDETFTAYSRYVQEFATETESVVEKSISYTWNSYCDYLCNPNGDSLCSVEDGVLKCKVNENVHKAIDDGIQLFIEKKNKFEEDIKQIYSELKEITKDFAKEDENKELMAKSLEDGQQAAINLFTQPLKCEETTVKCNEILEKPCIPFKCFDDVLFQVNNKKFGDFAKTLEQYNYAKIAVEKGGLADTDNEKEIEEKLSELSFETQGVYCVLSFILLFLILL